MNNLDFINIKSLLPTERFSEKRVQHLINIILKAESWTTPICIEINSHAIMDGHHRWEVAKRLGLSLIPCLRISYDKVRVMSRRKNYIVTPEVVIQAALSKNLLPYKTTKHVFIFKVPKINVALNVLF